MSCGLGQELLGALTLWVVHFRWAMGKAAASVRISPSQTPKLTSMPGRGWRCVHFFLPLGESHFENLIGWKGE